MKNPGIMRARTSRGLRGLLGWNPSVCSSSVKRTFNYQLNGRYYYIRPNISLARAEIVTSRYFSTTNAAFEASYPSHTVFPMPALSPTMETGTITSWKKNEGESFTVGDVLCSIETDKASVDFEAQDDGVLAKILRGGSTAVDLPVGTPICVVVEDEADVAAFSEFSADEETSSQPQQVESVAEPSQDNHTSSERSVDDAFVLTPAARHLSQSQGLDATVLAGSGKGGRVTKGDFLLALENGTHMPPLSWVSKQAAEAPIAMDSPKPNTAVGITDSKVVQGVDLDIPQVQTDGEFEDLPNSNMRKVIARRLTESKRDVPHFYSSVEVELDNVMVLRKKLAAAHDVKVSVNDLIIRSTALALRDVPEVNVTFDEKSNKVSIQNSIDISVAVATPTGLITPIVPKTDQLGLSDITASVRDLAGRAREGLLQPHEYQGGTFCITNLGMFGIDEFGAVINPPQAAILAVGGGTKRIVPSPYMEGAEEQEPPTTKTVMTARLSADRRAVDEATAALFLSTFRHYLSKPELLLL
mmetsp:Transcript_13755/g.20829  ORF Transcript_13755/g.20829 Transcript_13755/m.20829 type:complete len:528 (+) Transcript_13755:96-1679(+)